MRIRGADDSFALRHEKKESGSHTWPIKLSELLGTRGDIKRERQTVIKTRDAKRLDPRGPILEKNGGKEASGVVL